MSGSVNYEEEKVPHHDNGDVSEHMVARWYRPPEIILMCKNYDTKIYIWSMGCIFCELAYMWDNP